jgi:hypothetical protein
LLFNIIINDICDLIFKSKYILFADDIKTYHSISKVNDCELLQSDIDSVQSWCFENDIILNVGKTTVISFTRKSVSIDFNYKLCNNLILCSQLHILEFLWDCKLYLHNHIDFIFFQGL